jgi:hypothetical protein
MPDPLARLRRGYHRLVDLAAGAWYAKRLALVNHPTPDRGNHDVPAAFTDVYPPFGQPLDVAG